MCAADIDRRIVHRGVWPNSFFQHHAEGIQCLLPGTGSPGTDDCGVAKDIMADFSRHGIKQARSILPLTLLYTNTHGRIVADSIWLNFSTLHCTEDAQCLLPFSALFTRADGCIEATYVREYVRHKHRNEQDQRVLPLPGLTCTELVAIFALPMKSKVLLYKLCDDYHD